MKYNLVLFTAPTTEPLTLDEAKTFIRVDCADDDIYIYSLIIAARKFCENFQNRAYINQTWELSFDYWDCYNSIIEIPKGNLQSITSIIYKDYAGINTTINPANYIVSTRGILGRVAPAYGITWPSFVPYPLDSIVIKFLCGYGTIAENIPEPIKQAIYLLVSHWYDNRSPISNTMRISDELKFCITALLWQDRIVIL